MKKTFLLILLAFAIASCGSSKKTTKTIVVTKEGTPNRTKKVEQKKKDDIIIVTTTEADEVITAETNTKLLKKIIKNAETFEGTPYKFGGTTDQGMDCSGLVFTAFQQENVILPRISREMATRGVEIQLSEAEEGDLVFFKTSSRNRINHVGIVTKIKDDIIYFIHSTTSRGVITSSMLENYWKKAFVGIRRVI
ncbi:C40 family peptidase [Jejudonia soesokkakensis]|uniref:C40 family peptidase n=1 Tax=Jejudonia soesokkakensis TaxID=1323432 RepID=A0ABW2MS31_9FLAO